MLWSNGASLGLEGLTMDQKTYNGFQARRWSRLHAALTTAMICWIVTSVMVFSYSSLKVYVQNYLWAETLVISFGMATSLITLAVIFMARSYVRSHVKALQSSPVNGISAVQQPVQAKPPIQETLRRAEENLQNQRVAQPTVVGYPSGDHAVGVVAKQNETGTVSPAYEEIGYPAQVNIVEEVVAASEAAATEAEVTDILNQIRRGE